MKGNGGLLLTIGHQRHSICLSLDLTALEGEFEEGIRLE
jgi:hypothetical protein